MNVRNQISFYEFIVLLIGLFVVFFISVAKSERIAFKIMGIKELKRKFKANYLIILEPAYFPVLLLKTIIIAVFVSIYVGFGILVLNWTKLMNY